MTTLKGNPFLYKISGIPNVSILGTINPLQFKESLKYEPDDSDLFVCSYPKCGTTFVQTIIHLLQNNCNLPKANEELTMDNFLGYFVDKKTMEEREKPRNVKSHLPFDLVPYNPKTKYIYVTRNPFDCCISFHHHHTSFQLFDYEGSFPEFFELFLRGEVDCGDYFHNVASWYCHRNDPNILFLTYEELKDNTEEQVLKIANFIGGDAAELVKDKGYLKKATEACNFDSVSKNVQSRNLKSGTRKHTFFRKGINGDFRRVFDKRMYDRLMEKYSQVFKQTELIKKWEKYVAFEESSSQLPKEF